MARIHILGASASGTTTLGRALAAELGAAHFDTDAYYWEATDPPFTTPRAVEERLARLETDLGDVFDWVLSGSLMKWGDGLIPRFDLVVFLRLPPEIRMARLLARERERYGVEIEPGGRMHEAHLAFVTWARSYDQPDFTGRSLAGHRAWLAGVSAPVLEIDGVPSLEDSVARVLAALEDMSA